jgi:cathepsin E
MQGYPLSNLIIVKNKMILYIIVFTFLINSVLTEVINSQLENRGTYYVANIGIGNPPTNYNLLIDTGSGNTWIGSGNAYVKTSTSQQTPDSVSVQYGSSSFSGQEYIDQVTIADGLVISQQSIGVASTSSGFNNVDGVLGLGPVDLTVGTLSPDTNTNIPTVTDNLFSSGIISENLVGISFAPITDSSGSEINGEITWGGTDSSKFTGAITYIPITSTSPANTFWGIDASATYGETTILSTTAGMVDSSTGLISIATDAFQIYQKATGGVPDRATGLLSITPDQFSNLKSFFISIGGTTFELTANAQIFPRALNTHIGGTAGSIYLIIADIGTSSGAGLDFILGKPFMERFYTVFDTGNQRVGVATTPFTDATTN